MVSIKIGKLSLGTVPIVLLVMLAVVATSGITTEVIKDVIAQAPPPSPPMVPTDYNVHITAVCISIIIFTYCW